MKPEDSPALEDGNQEISALIQTLIQTEQRLEELTGGEVDTVADAGGRTFLLRRAQEQLRDNEAAKLRESERRFSNMLGNVELLSLMLDREARITYCNDYLLRLTGWRRDEVIGRDWFELFMPSRRDDMKAAFSALLTDMPSAAHHENTILTRSGGRRLIRWNNTVLRSTQGEAIGTASIGDDITERKDAERHLAQMESRYRGLLEAAPDAMVVVNQAGEIVLLNLQAEKQFAYRRDELLGQKVKSIIPEGFAERLVADGLRSAEDALAQQIGTGIELTGRRKDGSEFPIEIMLSPLESAEGTLVTAAIRDITRRKEAEGFLAQCEDRYRGLLEAAPDAMVVVNQRGGIVLLNLQAEKEFGYHRDELIGQKVTNIIPEGFAERLIADDLRSEEDALAQQIGGGIELTGRRKDGSEFPIEIMLSPLESAEGILVTAAVRDITTRKTAEAHLLEKMEELNRSNVELGEFASFASHDLQEPLRMVASYTQLLSRRYKGKLDPQADEFIAFAVDGATRMQQLIEDLLLYSRVGTKGNELRGTSSEAALQDALLNLRGAIEESGAVVAHGPLPSVMADERQQIQLFQNLVGNAIKYQRAGTPQIHISAVKNGGKKWTFSVQDNGLGIAPQNLEKIFGMFQRLHKREEFAGTGIGLAICKKIVERHGGHISVESQPGHGSTFRFALAGSEATS
jgi:PAS domain S-box-containing protein